jgi:predicted nucleic acid-binding protein
VIPLGIANSSPLIGLERIGAATILTDQFDRIVVPPAVAKEVGELPTGVQTESISKSAKLAAFPPRIHEGEAEVILLGFQHPDAVLILDDWYAREFAKARGLQVIGTVGLILRAKRMGLVPMVAPLLRRLQETGFRIAPEIIREAVTLAGEEP